MDPRDSRIATRPDRHRPAAHAARLAGAALLVALGCGGNESPAAASAPAAPAAPATTPTAPAADARELPAAAGDAPSERHGGWRLAQEASPYLREHADNPVEWFPWGSEAFERAKALDRPVFLSIGYSSCHWCHVMERESFQDAAIAAELNAHFVSIKVDREQRPDVDSQFMRALFQLTQGGGWPASLFLTPDGVPFAGGTYFPPEARLGLPGFLDVLRQIEALWSGERDELLRAAGDMRTALATDDLAALLARRAPDGAEPALDLPRTLELGVDAIVASLDERKGGVRGAPKFPPTLALDFLLRQYQRASADVLAPVHASLLAMDEGALHDHLAGGFFRYCVDEDWTVPHFEKPLADNALLAALYAEAAAVTGQARWGEVARSTLAWMRAELRSPEGLYFGALDADSLPFDATGAPVAGAAPDEGRYYVWRPSEITAVLGAAPGAAFAALFDVTTTGKFADGRSLPRPVRPREELAATPVPGAPVGADFLPWLDGACEQLAQARSRRPKPDRDEKCVAGWNGLAATAFARAGCLLDDAELRAESGRIAEALLLLVHEGEVAHQRFGGVTSGAGTLFDCAATGRGLLDAYAAAGDPRWLRAALDIGRALLRFQSAEGDFFETAGEDPLLPARGRELFDGALPSGASLAIELLLRLAPLDDSGALEAAAARAVARMGPLASEYATALPALLTALDHAAGPLGEIVLDGSGADADALRSTVRRTPLPAALVVPDAGALAATFGIDALPSLLEGRAAPPGGARAWVCVRRACLLPADTPAVLSEQLERVVRRQAPRGG
jgi:uncharacterized protein YyaL (SSP411 family)